jgi:hypothetical protein
LQYNTALHLALRLAEMMPLQQQDADDIEYDEYDDYEDYTDIAPAENNLVDNAKLFTGLVETGAAALQPVVAAGEGLAGQLAAAHKKIEDLTAQLAAQQPADSWKDLEVRLSNS